MQEVSPFLEDGSSESWQMEQSWLSGLRSETWMSVKEEAIRALYASLRSAIVIFAVGYLSLIMVGLDMVDFEDRLCFWEDWG